MRLQGRQALPLLDHDIAVDADPGLDAAHLGVDDRAVFDAALLGMDQRDQRAEFLQQLVALARLGGDVGEDMDHDGGSWVAKATFAYHIPGAGAKPRTISR